MLEIIAHAVPNKIYVCVHTIDFTDTGRSPNRRLAVELHWRNAIVG